LAIINKGNGVSKKTDLERLLARLVGRVIHDGVVLRAREVLVLERVERAPLAIYPHLFRVVDAQVLDLGDVLNLLHVRGIAPCAENNSDLGARVDVVRGDERAGGVVDERRELDGQLVFLKRLAEHGGDVTALGVGCAEALGPPDELAMVDAFLSGKF
jgi:hypothetical protein